MQLQHHQIMEYFLYSHLGNSLINFVPIAEAGIPQSADYVIVNPSPPSTNILNPDITLDGTGSSDLEGGSITYLWTIIDDAGTGITLDDVTSSTPSLSALVDVTGNANLIFGLVVNDGALDSALDTVTITIVDSGLVP